MKPNFIFPRLRDRIFQNEILIPQSFQNIYEYLDFQCCYQGLQGFQFLERFQGIFEVVEIAYEFWFSSKKKIHFIVKLYVVNL